MSLDGAAPSLDSAEEISTFCPVRLYLANRRFDGLLDTLVAKGGFFYVLTDGEMLRQGSLERDRILAESRVELAFGSPENELRIPCRVRGMRVDEEGLYAYMGVDFLFERGFPRRRLASRNASLW